MDNELLPTIITCSFNSGERVGKLSVGLTSRKPPVRATAFAIRITKRGIEYSV